MLVNFRDLERERISVEKQEKKVIESGEGTYSVLYLKYNFGTKDNPNKKGLAIEYPVGVSNMGITENTDKSGRSRESIFFRPFIPKLGEIVGNKPATQEMVDKATEDAKIWVEKMQMLKEVCAKGVFKQHKNIEHVKNNAKMDFILPTMKDIIYMELNDDDEPVEGTIPSQFLKLNPGIPKPYLRSVFNIVVGYKTVGEGDKAKKIPIIEEMPWSALYGKKITYRPVVNFYRIFSGVGSLSV
jgi:hypothetical protein